MPAKRLNCEQYRQANEEFLSASTAYRHQGWIALFRDALHRHGGKPGGGLLPVMAATNEWFSDPLYRGAFINITAELGDSFPDVLDICRSHKQDKLQFILELLPASETRLLLANAATWAVDAVIVRAQLESCEGARGALHGLALILAGLERPGVAAGISVNV